jgi:hypothetical protein
MGPILDTKNTALEFAKKIGSKHLVEHIRRLDEIAKSSNEGIDPAILSALISKQEREFNELLAICRKKKDVK